MEEHRNVTTLEDIEITKWIEKDGGIIFEEEWDPGEEADETPPGDLWG